MVESEKYFRYIFPMAIEVNKKKFKHVSWYILITYYIVLDHRHFSKIIFKYNFIINIEHAVHKSRG